MGRVIDPAPGLTAESRPYKNGMQEEHKCVTRTNYGSWQRGTENFAERGGNPAIWGGRLRVAEDLDAEADAAERAHSIRHKVQEV